MNYIDQTQYSKLLEKLNKAVSTNVLNEGLEEKKKELSPKQLKIAAAAPPPDQITGADFAALKAEKEPKKETLHRDMVGATDFTRLSPDERNQLKEYINTVKTVKSEIKKLMEKATMKEGGDMTKLTLSNEMFREPEEEGDDEGAIPGEEDILARMQAEKDFEDEFGYKGSPGR